MSLKTLWGALCDCFVTKIGFNGLFDTRLIAQKVFVSNQAMPSSNVTSYEYSSTTSQHFTAPTDGYLCITAQQSGSETYVSIWSGLGSAITGLNNLSAFVPCRKGETKMFSLSSIVSIEFVSTIGGGLNTIIQAIGGGLWIRLNHSFKRCSSYPAGKQCQVLPTLLKTQSLQARQLSHLSMDTQHSFLTRRLTTRFATQESRQAVSMQLFTQLAQTRQTVCNIREFTCLFAKAQTLAQSFPGSIQERFASLRQSAQANLCCEGGAL